MCPATKTACYEVTLCLTACLVAFLMGHMLDSTWHNPIQILGTIRLLRCFNRPVAVAYTRLPSPFAKIPIQRHYRSQWMSLGPRRFTVWPRLLAFNDQTLVDRELVLWKRLTFARFTNVYCLSSSSYLPVAQTLPPFSGLFSPLDVTEAVYLAENAGVVYQTLDMMPLFWQEASTAHEHLLTMYARIGIRSPCIDASH